jgi:hypothetical protein
MDRVSTFGCGKIAFVLACWSVLAPAVGAQSDEDLKRQAAGALALMRTTRPGPAQLAQAGSVQRDLKVTAEQAQQLKTLSQRAQAAVKQRLGAEQRKSLRLARELREETEKLLQEVLTGEQHRRLQQIALQLEIRNQGLTMVFTLEKLEDKLDLTAEQRAKMKQERQEFDQALVKAMRQGGTGKLKETLDGYQKASNARILALLSPDQRTKYDELVGPPFDFTSANDLPTRR